MPREGKSYIQLVWVAVALSVPLAMREARLLGKADTVPTPFFILIIFPQGTGGGK